MHAHALTHVHTRAHARTRTLFAPSYASTKACVRAQTQDDSYVPLHRAKFASTHPGSRCPMSATSNGTTAIRAQMHMAGNRNSSRVRRRGDLDR
eukprot:6190207-Pleurochrysis_carterae.AAC.1